MIKPRIVILPIIGLAAAAVLGFRVATASAGENGPARLHRDGRTEFHRQLKREFQLHTQTFSLEKEDAERILDAERRLPGLSDAVLRLMALDTGAGPRDETGTDSSARREWLALCRVGADRFIQSLFLREPVGGGADAPGTVLDQVLASLGLEPSSGEAGPPGPAADSSRSASGLDRLLRAAGFPEAHRLSRGAGVRIDVIGPAGPAWTRGGPDVSTGALFPWNGELAVFEGPSASHPAPLAAAAAPDSMIRFRPILRPPGSTCLYWSAFQAALAIEDAARAGARVVILAASFALDYPFLRDACLDAYQKHVVVVCPVGPGAGSDPEVPSSFPAHYTTTIAVVGATPAVGKGSHFNDLSGPGEPADSAALCGGAAALVASLMPPTEGELEGQYFQRIREVLVKAADPRPLRVNFYDPRAGYGLLRADASVGGELEAYRVRRKQLEDDFERRTKLRAEAERKAAAERAAAEAKRGKRP